MSVTDRLLRLFSALMFDLPKTLRDVRTTGRTWPFYVTNLTLPHGNNEVRSVDVIDATCEENQGMVEGGC